MKKWILLSSGVLFLSSGSVFLRLLYEKKLAEATQELVLLERAKAANEELLKSLDELDRHFLAIPTIKRTGVIGNEPYIEAFLNDVALSNGLSNPQIIIEKRAEGFAQAGQSFAAFMVDFAFEVNNEASLSFIFNQFDQNFEGYIIINSIDLMKPDSEKSAKIRLNLLVIFLGFSVAE